MMSSMYLLCKYFSTLSLPDSFLNLIEDVLVMVDVQSTGKSAFTLKKKKHKNLMIQTKIINS